MIRSLVKRQIIMKAVVARSRLPATALPATMIPLRDTRLFSSCAAAAEEEEPTLEEQQQSTTCWNAFDVLGVPERFSLDEKELKTKYRALMGEFHPDRNRQANRVQQELMREKSSAVTQAYQELTSDHTRAAHLMALRGKPMTESISQQVVGMDFLMQVMEIREEIEDISTGSDFELRMLLEQNEERMKETCRAFQEALEQDDLESALKYTARLQYWNRVTETIREKMDSME